MALYHFNWGGKERTVAMNLVGQNIFSFTFIDEEIIRQVADHLLLEKTESHFEYRNKEEIVSMETAASVIKSITSAVKSFKEIAVVNSWIPQANEKEDEPF